MWTHVAISPHDATARLAPPGKRVWGDVAISPQSGTCDRGALRPGRRVVQTGPMRVVLADDSVLLREGIARLLEEAGFEVVGQAGDAEELMLKVRSYSPAVALVDIRMTPFGIVTSSPLAVLIFVDSVPTWATVPSTSPTTTKSPTRSALE